MKTIPLTISQANKFINDKHRHHKPVTGHRFSIGCVKSGEIIGVCVVGRPVARNTSQYMVAEVTRLCTDGSKNACSFLYGAAARIAKEMGFESIQTFTLPEEGGVSLVASGWEMVAISAGGDWNSSSHKNRRTDQPQGEKCKWRKVLNSNASIDYAAALSDELCLRVAQGVPAIERAARQKDVDRSDLDADGCH